MTTITDNLIKLQELTQTNLKLLQILNDSLYTKQNHLTISMNDKVYTIPSFLSLENKINSLQENFENLVNSPSTGEAYFNFDGNSKTIEVRGYSHTPNSIVLNNISNFGVENNNIFKDFLTPNPFITVGLSSLPNDIVTVVVKKIAPINKDLINIFSSKLTNENSSSISAQCPYKDLYKILSSYKKDVDYIEYDTKQDLPIRKNIGSGLYVIQEIVSDIIDDDLNEFITVKLRNDINDPNYSNKLYYKLFNETIDRPLKVGDCLVTYNDSAKMEIVEVKTVTNELVLKVLNGDYLNLFPSTSNKPSDIHDLSKLKFYSPVDFDNDKYIKVPLEEDQYIFVAVAALNNRMNVQSPWGTGLIINTYNLLKSDDGLTSFKNYYRDNVNNVGDVLYEISTMMTNSITKYDESQFNQIMNTKPIINVDNLIVTQINSHLNDSESIKNIRALYSQKKNLEKQLSEINDQIITINQKLSEISFDDTTNIRSIYTNQLTTLNETKNKLNTSILKIVNDISYAANNSELPIDNAKYRIRGFFDCEEFMNNNDLQFVNNHIIGIDVQYRYKNINKEQGNALSINGKFIFSDWVHMTSEDLYKIPYYEDGYKYKIQNDNSNINEPSFNQIDIPISQGENVDIRLRLVYDFGYPYVRTMSGWSDIVTIEFPQEYSKNVQILDIIAENNNDIETNRFNNIIKDAGIYDHVSGSLVDQDIKYFHKPEDIASGFYTQERRIIPLKDKLLSIDSLLKEIYDDIYGGVNDQLKVSIIEGEKSNILQPYIINNIGVAPYDSFTVINSDDKMIASGNYIMNNKTGVVTTNLIINIHNNSSHTLKLYSIFPGSRDTEIKDLKHIRPGIDKSDFFIDDRGVFGITELAENNQISQKAIPQYANQYITFRMRDINNGRYFYQKPYDNDTFVYRDEYICSDPRFVTYNLSNINTNNSLNNNKDISCAFMYPIYTSEKQLCLDSDVIGSFKTLAPGEHINIPIVFEYRMNMNTDTNDAISKIMSFDIKTSLYKDPITYAFRVTAKKMNTEQDKLNFTSNLSKYNTTYK